MADWIETWDVAVNIANWVVHCFIEFTLFISTVNVFLDASLKADMNIATAVKVRTRQCEMMMEEDKSR